MNLSKTAATLTIMFFALTGCVPDGDTSLSSKQVNYLKAENLVRKHTGDGVCMVCFNSYRTRKSQKAFAMATSGEFGLSSGQKTSALASKNALSSCRASLPVAKKGNCKLLMINDRYVWK